MSTVSETTTPPAPDRRRGGRPAGSKSQPKDRRAAAQLLKVTIDLIRRGQPSISPATGLPLKDENGRVVYRPLSAAHLQAARAILRDLGVLDRAAKDPEIVTQPAKSHLAETLDRLRAEDQIRKAAGAGRRVADPDTARIATLETEINDLNRRISNGS